MSYIPVGKSLTDNVVEPLEPQPSAIEPFVPEDWHGGPKSLGVGRLESIAIWTWDILLTVAPVCFFVLAILALRLEGEPPSSYGRHIVDLTRLSPTIYPILFAALAGRFFKNFARWRLEKAEGVELATLEQIFGSQSLAGAIERLLFVRTQITVGILILLAWSLSPLGGQSAARLLHIGNTSASEPVTVYYAHPSYQGSWFVGSSSQSDAVFNVNLLYTSSLLASPTQKRYHTDLWNLPKIPQWPRHLGDGVDHLVDKDALSGGDDHYASLLGVKVDGLSSSGKGSIYNFTIETMYHDFDCGLFRSRISVEELSSYVHDPLANPYEIFNASNREFSNFGAWLTLPNLTSIFPDLENKPLALNDVPPAYMLFAAVDQIYAAAGDSWSKYLALFNCTVRPVVVETNMLCSSTLASTDCWAEKQKRVNNRYKFNNVYHLLTPGGSVTRSLVLRGWRTAEQGRLELRIMSSTENYLAGELYPFALQSAQNWTAVPMEAFSRRLTTLFNTYWEGTLDPFNHTDVEFRGHQNLTTGSRTWNETAGFMTSQDQVYRVNRHWVAILIITTLCLEILAVAGAVLQLFIRGPDVLGFASSLTRENPHVGLPAGGSGLDGPARARALSHLRVQLSDVCPKGEIGYIALKSAAVSERQLLGNDEGWMPLDPKRLYH